MDFRKDSYFDLFECEYVGASSVRSSVGTKPIAIPHLLRSLAEPCLCSVLEVVISVHRYVSDRSCYLPELNLVSEAVLVE